MKVLAAGILLVDLLLAAVCVEVSQPSAPAEISVEPASGGNLTTSRDEPSCLRLDDIVVHVVVCEERLGDIQVGEECPGLSGHVTNHDQEKVEADLVARGYEDYIVTQGAPVLVVRGTFQNRHRAYFHIAMEARGYDAVGEMVSETLDSAHLPGCLGLGHSEAKPASSRSA